MTTKVKAIVLKAIDYKEKDKLLTLFTLEQGKLICSMRGVKAPNAKLKFAKETFCFGEFIIENTKGNNIVTQVEIIDNFFEITQNIDKFYVFDKFLLKIFKNFGYYFLSYKCPSCGYDLNEVRYFNLDIGEFVCTNCKTNICLKVSNACFSGLRFLEQTDYDRLKSLRLGGDAEIEIYNLLDKNFEWRFGKRFVQII